MNSRIKTTESDLNAKDKDQQTILGRAHRAESKLADLKLEAETKIKRIRDKSKREIELLSTQLKKLQQSQQKALEQKVAELEEKKVRYPL